MQKTGDHAVVLGASMAGLLAARVLTDHFDRVTIVERDRLENSADPRRGVPQGSHAHLLLGSGSQVIEDLFPGFLEDLEEDGVPVLEKGPELYFSLAGHLIHRDARLPTRSYQASRPYLENQVRRRTLRMPAVTVRAHCDVVGLRATEGATRVTGVRILSREPRSADEVLAADLVVDATGRTGRTPVWLRELGYQAPPVEELAVDLKYVSQFLRLPADALGGVRTLVVGAEPGRPTGLVLIAQEQGRWRLTQFGYAGHHPPTDPDGYRRFAASFAPPEVLAAIQRGEALDAPHAHRFPSNLRRRYERLRRFPDGLLVIGDAVCSFNPLYGQGMSVAALEARHLHRCLASGPDRLARRYFRAIGRQIDTAWQLATGGDLSLPVVEGPRSLRVRAVNAYLARLHVAATHDPVVTEQFLRVTALLAPPARLFRPDIVARVVGSSVGIGRWAAPHVPAPSRT